MNLYLSLFVCLFIKHSLARVNIVFDKCGTNGFTCENSTEIPGTYHLKYQCNASVTDVQLDVWNSQLTATASLTIENCNKMKLWFTCYSSSYYRILRRLILKNIGTLEIPPSTLGYNPPEIFFENITFIQALPRGTFMQVTKVPYKTCTVYSTTDLNTIEFKNVNIGRIETEAFKNLTDMKIFSWDNVNVSHIEHSALKLEFQRNGQPIIKNSNLNKIETLAIQIVADAFTITRGIIQELSPTSINGTVTTFQFTHNTVTSIQSDAIAILSQNTYITNNYFMNVESGAFKKVGPGLLYNSRKSLGKSYFAYNFSSNIFEHVEHYGIRPDVESYKNVASYVNVKNNKLQCSCEGVSGFGTDANLGARYAAMQDFNAKIIEPRNKNKCDFSPCMCFSARPQIKKRSDL